MSEAQNEIPDQTQEELAQRCALALLYVDLDSLTPQARERARASLARSSDEFDGAELVDICLRDAQPLGPRGIERAMIALRSRFLGMDAHVATPRRSRGRNTGKRFLAWLLVKLIFWPILIVLTVVILILVKRNWPEIDIYVWGGKALDFLGLR